MTWNPRRLTEDGLPPQDHGRKTTSRVILGSISPLKYTVSEKPQL